MVALPGWCGMLPDWFTDAQRKIAEESAQSVPPMKELPGRQERGWRLFNERYHERGHEGSDFKLRDEAVSGKVKPMELVEGNLYKWWNGVGYQYRILSVGARKVFCEVIKDGEVIDEDIFLKMVFERNLIPA